MRTGWTALVDQSAVGIFVIMKAAVVVLPCLFFLQTGFAQNYTLNGHIAGVDTGYAYIRHREYPGVDSARITNGRFTIKGKVSKPEFCAFGFRSVEQKDYYFSIFIEPANMMLLADKRALNDTAIRVGGSRTEREFQQFKINTARHPEQTKALFQKLSPAIRNSPFGRAMEGQ